MVFWTIIGILVPILLFFLRRSTESQGWMIARQNSAFYIAWACFLIAWWKFEASHGDNFWGANSYLAIELSNSQHYGILWMLVLGWIPALVLVVFLSKLRRWALAMRAKGLPGTRIAIATFAIVLTGSLWLLHYAWTASVQKQLDALLPNVSRITVITLAIPQVFDSELENDGRLEGSAELPVDVFIRAARSAQYSGLNKPSPEPGFFAIVNHPQQLNARLGENHFAFESIDGYFPVVGTEGEEYRRQFKAERDAALANLKAQLAPYREQP